MMAFDLLAEAGIDAVDADPAGGAMSTWPRSAPYRRPRPPMGHTDLITC